MHSGAECAGGRDPRTGCWRGGGASAHAETGTSEEIARSRSRDLKRSNGCAGQIVDTVTDHVVGTGIVGAPTGIKGRNAKKVSQGWAEWGEVCDFEGDHDINGLMWSAVNGMNESGARSEEHTSELPSLLRI